MYDLESVYRPPAEKITEVLQVTTGCSYNKCRFCGMYKNEEFRISSIDEIVIDIEKIKTRVPDLDRIYLIHGDAFVLSYNQLKVIIHEIKTRLPKVETMAMFGSISNIMGKTDKELYDLKRLGVNDITIGIESGWDDVLRRMDKGHSSSEMINECKRLSEVGINYSFSVMMGIGGRLYGRENAHITAEVVNMTKPIRIDIAGLTLSPNSLLAKSVKEKTFIESTEYEMVEELITLIEHLSIETYLDATHCSTTIRVSGQLPYEKEKLIEELKSSLENFNEKKLRRRREKYMTLST